MHHPGVLHVLALLGVLDRDAGRGSAAWAGSRHCCMPLVQFWYFNTRFAYEAFAIILFIWSTVSVVHLQMASPLEWSRTGWLLNGVLVAFARECAPPIQLRQSLGSGCICRCIAGVGDSAERVEHQLR
ncbi:MAG: hypothetical protein R2706_13350 [Acidimicrobiales bacterium]